MQSYNKLIIKDVDQISKFLGFMVCKIIMFIYQKKILKLSRWHIEVEIMLLNLFQ